MKVLTLKNGNEINFTDTSTIYNLIGVYNTYAEVDDVREQLTAENLVSCEFDNEKYHGIIPVGASVTSEMSGNVTATFTTREMTDVEKINEHLSETDEAVNYLLMKEDEPVDEEEE